ncbi:MAG: hypothetical protein JNM49_09770 [Flavobacteriales bacterium]|jgi:hypothetical protein|nr:hypothetical protein [Flavobacteriales bacterium]
MTKPQFLVVALLLSASATAQNDLLGMLGEEETGPEYTNAAFKTTRVINAHSLENTAPGVLDFRIGHRFGPGNGGLQDFFGLDGATVRLGFDYGVTDRLMVGFGRSGYQKTLDGFVKYKLVRQCDAGCSAPITLAIVAASSMTTLDAQEVPWYDPNRKDYFTHRLSYAWTVILGRKFSEAISLQINPGVVHRNLVAGADDPNDVFHASGAGRVKITKRLAFNAEYFHVLRNGLDEGFQNSLSVGFDVETGGHVFQLHLSNSAGMFDRAFITETNGDWARTFGRPGDGAGIHFGFNISRVFTVNEPKKRNG